MSILETTVIGNMTETSTEHIRASRDHIRSDENELNLRSLKDSKKPPDYCQTIHFIDNNGECKQLVFPKGLDLDRPKRARTTFSAQQLASLEEEFKQNQYLVGAERNRLARMLGLSETQVKVWFQNRRTKYKRDKCKEAKEHKSQTETLATCNILRLLHPRPIEAVPVDHFPFSGQPLVQISPFFKTQPYFR